MKLARNQEVSLREKCVYSLREKCVYSLREKYVYSELFLSAFSQIRTEYGLRISPYSVQMREKVGQNNFECGQILCSVSSHHSCWVPGMFLKISVYLIVQFRRSSNSVSVAFSWTCSFVISSSFLISALIAVDSSSAFDHFAHPFLQCH